MFIVVEFTKIIIFHILTSSLLKVQNNYSCFMGFSNFFMLILAFQVVLVSSTEFNVGGKMGWVVPQSEDDQHYNDWASENRFKVNDTLNFDFKDDSVLVVSENEYEKCISARPMFFSNNGNTVFKLDRPGLFYFISGVSGHCSKGLKMVVKVLDIQSPSPQSANQTTNSSHKATHNEAIELNTVLPFVAICCCWFILDVVHLSTIIDNLLVVLFLLWVLRIQD